MTPQEALERIRSFSRPASIAQIGGFRPPEDSCTSWFGGNFLGTPGETWPIWNDSPMIPLLQVRVDELPVCPPALENITLLTVFFSLDSLYTPIDNGIGWQIRTYSDLEHLAALPMPNPDKRWPKLFPIRWNAAPEDAPNWENSWNLDEAAMEIINSDDTYCDLYGDFERCYQTKVGGWPTYIQGAPNLDPKNFVLQIASEEKAQWMLVDSGNIYVFCSPDGKWTMHLDFY